MSDNPTAAPEGIEAPAATPTPGPMDKQPKVFDEAYVKSLRDEAAAARIAKKDAVEAAEKLLNEKHQAELAERDTAYAELQNQLAAAWIELQKYQTAADAKVPSDKLRAFVDILQGTDAESIGASAKKNLELIGGFSTKSPAFDPSQGIGGKKPLALNGDPILQSINALLGIK